MGHIFSGEKYGLKFSGKWGKLNAAERGHLNLMQGIYNKKDVKKISKSEIKDLKALVKVIAEAVAGRYDAIMAEGLQTPATMDLEESGGYINYESDDPFDLLTEYNRGKSFLDDETSTTEGAEEFNKEVAVDADKWTILKRLKDIDPTLQVNKGYASMVLHEIEFIIQEQRYTVDEITAMMIDRLQVLKSMAEEAAKGIEPFD